MVLIENVRGITLDFVDVTTASGRTNYARRIIEALAKDFHVSTKLIDTSEFGVPQKRHRFFIIAFRKFLAAAEPEPFKVIKEGLPSFLRRKGITAVPVSAKMAISDLELRRNGKLPSRDSKGLEIFV